MLVQSLDREDPQRRYGNPLQDSYLKNPIVKGYNPYGHKELDKQLSMHTFDVS